MKISSDTIAKIPYFLIIIFIVYQMKPSVFFKPNGKPRVYGLGIDDEGFKKTLYTFESFILLLTIFILNFT